MKDLLAHVHKVEGGCWVWLKGSTHTMSYGPIRDVYSQSVGRPVEGGWICHQCDNEACVNPDHLYLGDPKTNAQDRLTGSPRVYRGITDAEVLALRVKHQSKPGKRLRSWKDNPRIRLVERANRNRDIETLVREARATYGTSTEAAASSLGVSSNTFRHWERQLANAGQEVAGAVA